MTYKIVSSNGKSRHVMYVDGLDAESATNYAIKVNTLLKRFPQWQKFGGHKYAAGLTLDASNLEAFQQRFEEVVSSTITADMLTPLIEIDSTIPLDAVNSKFVNVC